MEPITLYLKKFKAFTPPERFIRQAVVASVRELIGEVLKEESVRVRGATVFIAAHPTIKAELFMRKKELLGCISGKLFRAHVAEVH